jgi:glyoxalase family protein
MSARGLAIAGLHHVTAIAREPRRNADFYVGVLGLRLVKRTVNFDHQATYHLYYGDRTGRPGTLLTFFVRPQEPSGRRGTGQATSVRFSVPAASLSYWAERLTRHAVAFVDAVDSFESQTLTFSDPDGLEIQLVATHDYASLPPTPSEPVAAEHALRGLHGIALSVSADGPTAMLLTGAMGFVETGSGPDRRRFSASGNGLGLFVDLLVEQGVPQGSIAAGSVHHVAFRTGDTLEQQAWQARLRADGLAVTDVKDRKYFRSIYFDEPGGVRFEIATDTPGFAVDEPPDALGTRLLLPASLEPERKRLEAGLRALDLTS